MRGAGTFIVVVAAAALAAACHGGDPAPRGASVASVPDATPAVPDDFPDADTSGVPAGTPLDHWTGNLALSGEPLPITEIDGQRCSTVDGYRVDLTGDEQLRVDVACVLIRNSSFATSGEVSSLVVQGPESRLLVIEDSTFDGGPFHARGVQGDYGTIEVRRSAFYRFGNAAVEMNDRSGTADLLVEDCFLYETGGWPHELHVDGVQMDAGRDLVVRNSTIIVTPFGDAEGDYDYVSNATIGVGATLGDIRNVTLEHNLLAGGGRLIYLQQKDFRFTGTAAVLDNVFDQRFSPTGAIWGPLHPDGLPANLVWDGNRWGDGSAVDLDHALAASP